LSAKATAAIVSL